MWRGGVVDVMILAGREDFDGDSCLGGGLLGGFEALIGGGVVPMVLLRADVLVLYQ